MVAPCPGVSSVPKGLVELALSTDTVFEPMSVNWPNGSYAWAWKVKVPFPEPGSMLVSTWRPQPARSAFGRPG